MEEKKVRREIQFNDIEKMNRFRMLYGDLFQSINGGKELDERSYSKSNMEGFEYRFTFHMNKENFDMLKKNSIVKKLRQASYKETWMKCYKKDIWVLC